MVHDKFWCNNTVHEDIITRCEHRMQQVMKMELQSIISYIDDNKRFGSGTVEAIKSYVDSRIDALELRESVSKRRSK